MPVTSHKPLASLRPQTLAVQIYTPLISKRVADPGTGHTGEAALWTRLLWEGDTVLLSPRSNADS